MYGERLTKSHEIRPKKNSKIFPFSTLKISSYSCNMTYLKYLLSSVDFIGQKLGKLETRKIQNDFRVCEVQKTLKINFFLILITTKLQKVKFLK